MEIRQDLYNEMVGTIKTLIDRCFYGTHKYDAINRANALLRRIGASTVVKTDKGEPCELVTGSLEWLVSEVSSLFERHDLNVTLGADTYDKTVELKKALQDLIRANVRDEKGGK